MGFQDEAFLPSRAGFPPHLKNCGRGYAIETATDQ